MIIITELETARNARDADRGRSEPTSRRMLREGKNGRWVRTYRIAIIRFIRTRTRRHESTRSRCTNSGLARAPVLS